MTKGPVPRPAVDRVLAKVSFQPRGQDSDCWVFMGRLNDGGYGLASIDGTGRQSGTHRIVFEHFADPIPDGLVLDHLCRVPACCNPDHLEPVTRRENLLRGHGALMKAHRSDLCLRGHSLIGCRVKKGGGRTCRECDRLRHRGDL